MKGESGSASGEPRRVAAGDQGFQKDADKMLYLCVIMSELRGEWQ